MTGFLDLSTRKIIEILELEMGTSLLLLQAHLPSLVSDVVLPLAPAAKAVYGSAF